jgi:hypothetical protein
MVPGPARYLTKDTLVAAGANASDDWRQYNKTLDGQRFSPLKQISTGNAATVNEVCRVEGSHRGSFQAGPLEVNASQSSKTRWRWMASPVPSSGVIPITANKRGFSPRTEALPITTGVFFAEPRALG